MIDYNWVQFAPKDAAKLAKKKDSELLNGRLAMIAVGGIATQSITTGHGFPYL
jgi:Chlorophyll A-B binding protein